MARKPVQSRMRCVHSRTQTRFVASVALVYLACVAIPCFAQLGLPAGIQVMVDEAEENYFDGDLDNAARCLEEAERWLDNKANKREMAIQGYDHSMVKSMLAGFRADILFARGEHGKARAALGHAEQVLKNRRQHYVVRNIFPPFLWHYEAFLNFVRGDLSRPTPDFGLADDPHVPESLRTYLVRQGNPRDAKASYRNGEAVMFRPMARQNTNERAFNRLEGRLFTRLASVTLLKAGRPTFEDLRDAESYLERAEMAFARDPFWRQFIKQEQFGEIPNAYKDIAGNEPDPNRKLVLKRWFGQTLSDWVDLQLLRVELSAHREHADADAVKAAVTTAEQRYDRIVGFLKAQYHPAHPRVQEVRHSRARWLLTLARSPKAAPETRMSWLQDCLLELDCVKNLKAADMDQKNVIELVARSLILELNAEAPAMDEKELAACADRVKELTRQFEARAAAAKAPPIGRPDEAKGDAQAPGEVMKEVKS